jgi:FdhD protein
MNKGSLNHIKIFQVKGQTQHVINEIDDLLVIEEPLEIRIVIENDYSIEEKSIAVTMRTPTHDFELVLGFLFTEGMIQHFSQIKGIRYCMESNKRDESTNIVKVTLNPSVDIDWERLQRNFYTTSSCGICGKSSIASIRTMSCYTANSLEQSYTQDLIFSLNQKAKAHQINFKYTGGLHASALFDDKGNILIIREDVGRHNALDKVIGAMFAQNKLPLEDKLLWVSGRLSFELVQKAMMAGIHTIVAVGAPSSLAVDLAKEVGMTLIGFAKEEKFNIYCGKERIVV